MHCWAPHFRLGLFCWPSFSLCLAFNKSWGTTACSQVNVHMMLSLAFHRAQYIILINLQAGTFFSSVNGDLRSSYKDHSGCMVFSSSCPLLLTEAHLPISFSVSWPTNNNCLQPTVEKYCSMYFVTQRCLLSRDPKQPHSQISKWQYPNDFAV